jgi:hypothetical protein
VKRHDIEFLWAGSTPCAAARLVVYVGGESGTLAAARIHDDADPPL